ncbi:DUF4312 family protein [Utexia brackfieldae]|uniref:DUF4312 family protein n=1 Tax=Utexia brackfieldae TaxID=3074108 RepID=UPI00370D82C7
MKDCQQLTVRVQGSADSKQRAFALALSSVQKEVLKNNTNIIIRIEPVDVAVVSATEKITTEKFLFFFLSRQRASYSITLDVTVDVCFIDITKINFAA